MPTTPTTKSQVQAYRFVLRRMQSALVRKDAVMLHDPMRNHSRATIVGVILAALGMVVFIVWGLLSPDPKPPDKDSILISKQSGQIYVLFTNPKQLVPTFNLASARLLLVARQQQQQQQQQGGQNNNQQQQKQGTAAAQGPEPATVVDDKELKDIPRGRLTGIQNGPDLLPTNDQRIDPYWAVCDAYKLDDTLNKPASQKQVEESRPPTTVLGGIKDLGPELAKGEALLAGVPDKDGKLKDPSGRFKVPMYLVYRTPTDANIRNANAVRAKVDMNEPKIRAALNLNGDGIVRQITTGMLNAIPEAPELVLPDIPGRNGSPEGFDLEGQKVGSVFSVERAGQPDPDYYVLLKNGKQKIKRTTADLIRFTRSVSGDKIAAIPPSTSAGVPDAPGAPIDDSVSPEVQPTVLTAQSFPVACLGWNLVGDSDEHTAVHIGREVPIPRKSDGKVNDGVAISTPGSDGQKIDHFYMTPGRAAVVRGANSSKDFGTGPIYLVSDRGVKYGVPTSEVAGILGVTNQKPAPQSIMRLLPDGASLNLKDVLQTYDSVPTATGIFEKEGGS
jgi:type VII secretion protein EccB